jgi:hypothetical protein
MEKDGSMENSRIIARIITGVALAGGVFFVAVGVWAFADPSSFYDKVALFPPYNRHLLHDIGAFQIGLGAIVLLSLWSRDSMAVALIGSGIGSAMHALAHVIDHADGGDIGQTVFFWILAAVLLAAGAARHARGSAAS